MIDSINYCEELEKVMRSAGFSEDSISKVTSDGRFIDGMTMGNNEQKIALTVVLNNIITRNDVIVPDRVRLSLSMGITTAEWFNDVRQVFLPYLKQNEDLFFR